MYFRHDDVYNSPTAKLVGQLNFLLTLYFFNSSIIVYLFPERSAQKRNEFAIKNRYKQQQSMQKGVNPKKMCIS